MPRRDGTGPMGNGPMQGRGLGACSRANTGNRENGFDQNQGLGNSGGLGKGKGGGFGRGKGRGRGFGRCVTRDSSAK